MGVAGGEIFQWKTNCSSLNVLACLSKWVIEDSIETRISSFNCEKMV